MVHKRLMQEKTLGTRRTLSIVYNSQIDGQIERIN